MPVRSLGSPWLGSTILLLVCAGMATSGSAGDHWPQFRGPDGQGHAGPAAVPVEFGENQRLRWKTPLPGRGWSSPLVGEDAIWLTTAVEASTGQSLRALEVDAASGRLVREVEVFAIAQPDLPTLNLKNSFASPTGVLEPGRHYVHYGTMGTAAIDTGTGQVLWRNQDLRIDHKEGPGSSLVAWGRTLIVHCDGMDAQYVVALDKQTGQVVWKRERGASVDPNPDLRKAYCTPLVIDTPAGEQLISPAADHVFSYDPATGRELWRFDYKGFSNVPRPLFGHGLVYLCTGYMKPELWAFRPEGSGVRSDSELAWRLTEQVPAIPSPILVGDELYMVSNNGVATCLDAHSGEMLWRERLGGDFSASPVVAGGLVYFSNEKGEVFVLRPGRTFELVATNQLDAPLMASPAVVNGALILRTETHLYRFQD